MELHPELKGTLEEFAVSYVDIGNPEEITFEQQKILAEINKYFSENIKNVLPNYNRNIPNRDEYYLIITGLPEVEVMQRLAEPIQSPFDAKDNNSSYTTISDSNTDEEFKDANGPISSEESNTLLIPERLQPENSVIATDQTSDIQNNNIQPNYSNNDAPRSEKKSKLPIVAASTLAIAGVALGIAIAVHLEMLAIGAAVGACCLVAAAVIHYCNSPASSLKECMVPKSGGMGVCDS